MKSYFLEGVCSSEMAIEALRRNLPGQEHPWLLRNPSGDAIAYFDVVAANDPELRIPAVRVDISGRYFNSDAQVLAVLRSLQAQLGGDMTDDQ